MYDVIIIGGSYAGLAAALQLGRARRKVLIVDAGQRRNRFASHSHGFLGQDGEAPGAIAAKGRAEVLAYSSVSWLDAVANEAQRAPDGFVVHADNAQHRARRLILATGVVDELPAIPGLAERWGKRVFLCPYCDGYELGLGRLGVLATGARSAHYAVLVTEWAARGGLTLFVNDAVEPDAAELAQLAAREVTLERDRVVGVGGSDHTVDLHLASGRTSTVDALFMHTRTRFAVRFDEQLGCETEAGPLGPFYKTDASRETTVPGVFACGDAAQPLAAVAHAVSDGVRAGAFAHQSLVFRP